MLEQTSVLIISPDQLAGMGLRVLLQDTFAAGHVDLIRHWEGIARTRGADVIFLPAELYLAHEATCRPVRSRLVILSASDPSARPPDAPPMLNVTLGQGELIDRLKEILVRFTSGRTRGDDDTLTERETEVLKLVARGLINKQVADRLSISLHTVISHRKNITRKLGIRSVSGLTAYALLNGLVSPKAIE